MLKKLMTALLSLGMIGAMCLTAFAAEMHPDLSRKGSITVTVRDTETKQPVSGGTLTLFQVAFVEVNNGYVFTPVEDFASSGCSLENLDDPTLAESLAAYAKEKKLSGTACQVDTHGQAVFSDLELGVYLVVQNEAAKGYPRLNPFLVSIPMKENGTLIYDVDATPKAGTVTPEKPDEPGEPDEPDEPNTPETSGNAEKTPRLPQTGQLWWPVPLMAVSGMLLAAYGWKKNRNEEE